MIEFMSSRFDARIHCIAQFFLNTANILVSFWAFFLKPVKKSTQCLFSFMFLLVFYFIFLFFFWGGFSEGHRHWNHDTHIHRSFSHFSLPPLLCLSICFLLDIHMLLWFCVCVCVCVCGVWITSLYLQCWNADMKKGPTNYLAKQCTS